MSDLLSQISLYHCINVSFACRALSLTEVDLNNLLSNNVTEFSQQLLDIPEAGFPNESVQDVDVRPRTIDELREIKVSKFTEKKEVSIKLNCMKIKNDLIKAFQDIKVSQIWKIFVINLCYNKYTQTLN